MPAGVADAVTRGDPSPANVTEICVFFPSFWSPGLSQHEGKMHHVPKGAAGDSAVF